MASASLSFWLQFFPEPLDGSTVDSHYLEFQGLSEILRDILPSTYQICRIEEKLIQLTTFNKYMCNWTPEVRYIENIVEKRRNCS